MLFGGKTVGWLAGLRCVSGSEMASWRLTVGMRHDDIPITCYRETLDLSETITIQAILSRLPMAARRRMLIPNVPPAGIEET